MSDDTKKPPATPLSSTPGNASLDDVLASLEQQVHTEAPAVSATPDMLKTADPVMASDSVPTPPPAGIPETPVSEPAPQPEPLPPIPEIKEEIAPVIPAVADTPAPFSVEEKAIEPASNPPVATPVVESIPQSISEHPVVQLMTVEVPTADVTPQVDAQPPKKGLFGFSFNPKIAVAGLVIAILTVGAVVANTLIGSNQDLRQKATGIACGAGSCKDGWQYGEDCSAPQGSCSQRADEACKDHGGPASGGGAITCGGGGGSTNPGSGGSTNKSEGDICDPNQGAAACDGSGPLGCNRCTAGSKAGKYVCSSGANNASYNRACGITTANNGATCTDNSQCQSGCCAGSKCTTASTCAVNGGGTPAPTPNGSIGQICPNTTDVVCQCKIGEICNSHGAVGVPKNGVYCYPQGTTFSCTAGSSNPGIDPNAKKEGDACNQTSGNRGACGVGCDVGEQLTCNGSTYVCTKTDACATQPSGSVTQGGSCTGLIRLSGGEPSHGAFIGCSGKLNCFCPDNTVHTGSPVKAGNISCFTDVGNDSCGAPGQTTSPTAPPTTPPSTSSPTPTPTPTPVPKCNSTCTTNASCPTGLICSSGKCRNSACTTSTTCTCASASPSPSPTPTAPPLACLKITSDTPTPVLGSQVRFTCGLVTGAETYEFRYKYTFAGIDVGGTLTATGNLSEALNVSQTGTYKAQCRPCVGSACAPWEAW